MKVSIITTIYKAEKDLPRLLDSMMALKSPELEFFLIDNGSPDRCGEICAEYAEKDSRFFIRSLKDNIGYIGARNLGLQEVDADYVGFCDSDDILEPQGYDFAIRLLKETDCDLLIASYKEQTNDTWSLKKPPFKNGIYSGSDLNVIKSQVFGFVPGCKQLKGFVWKHIYRYSIINENGLRFMEELKPYDDEIFNLDFVNESQCVVVDEVVIYNYINNPASITQKMLTSFSIQQEWTRIKVLYQERKKRSFPAVEEAINNTMLEYLYGLVLWTVKSNNDTIRTKVKRFISVIDQDIIDEMCENHSNNLGHKMNFFIYCLKYRYYLLLFLVIKISLKGKYFLQ